MKKTEVISARITPELKQEIKKTSFTVSELIEIGLNTAYHNNYEDTQKEILKVQISECNDSINETTQRKNKLTKQLNEVNENQSNKNQSSNEEALRKIQAKLTRMVKRQQDGLFTPYMSYDHFYKLCKEESVSPAYVYARLPNELRDEIKG